MFRAALLTLVAMLGACSGRSSPNDSAGAAGVGGASNAGSSGGPAMTGGSSTVAGSSSTSGGNEVAGGSGMPEGGDTSTSGAATAGSAAGGADGEAGATSGEGGNGTSLECPSGCSAGSEPFCEGGGVTWVCFGPDPIDYQSLVDGGCVDLATQVPRFCCPASFHPECHQ